MLPAALVLGAVLMVVPATESYDLRGYPVAAVDWLEERELLGRESKLFHEDQVGNYLELRFGTGVAVYLDDRFELHDAALIESYIDFARVRPAWRDALEGKQIIVWRAATPGDVLVSQASDWRVAYRDTDWLVACRRGTPVEPRC